jgi:xylulose-5-phosphate/fructose-6-phosphate phosphoketolase
MADEKFERLFTQDRHVVFAFHGYSNVVHALLHGRRDAGRFHVRGYREEGTTTTPFDMVVLNEMSRYHLAKAALQRVTRVRPQSPGLIAELESLIRQAVAYSREHLEDLPEIRDWRWSA